MEQITGKENERLKFLSALKKRKHRYRHRRFLIEGLLLIEEALSSHLLLERIFVSTSFQGEREQELLLKVREQGIPCSQIIDSLFKKVADTVQPQGILAVAVMPGSPPSTAARKRVLVVDGVGDPGNLGTMIRTAQAVGCDGLLLIKGTVDPYSSKVIRGAMGALFQLPMLFFSEREEALRFLTTRGFSLVVADSRGRPFYSVNYREPIALIVGSESQGVGRVFLDSASTWARIPLDSKVESLNVSLAAGIILYEIYRQGDEGARGG